MSRRKKVCQRCKVKGLFKDAKQKHCNRCNHEIAGHKLIEKGEGKNKKKVWVNGN